MTRLLLLLASLLFALGGPAELLSAADWFVAGTGSDANAGTTAATAFRTISHAMGAASSGDRILVGTGTYDTAVGEVFPIALADGVALEGPGDGSAIVDDSASAGAAFRVGALASPATISGLKILGHPGSGTCIRVTAPPVRLSILGNEMNAWNGFVNSSGLGPLSGGATVLTVEDNVVTAGSGSAAVALGWAVNATTAAHDVTFRNNTVLAGGVGILAVASTTGTQGAGMSVVIESNAVASCFLGIAVAGGPGPGGHAQVDLAADVLSNTASGCSGGIFVRAFHNGTTGAAALDVLCSGNRMVMNSAGLVVAADAEGSNGAVTLSGSFLCNQAVANSAAGLRIAVSGDTNGTGMLDASFLYNEFTGNATGIKATVFASDTGQARFLAPFRGNVISGNSGDGVRVDTSAAFAGVAVAAPDFGGSSAADLGRNTISGNGTGGGAFDFNLAGAGPGQSVVAEGNWWGASSAAGIDPLVNDQADNAAFGALDFAPFLAAPLIFTADRSSYTGGQFAILTADPTTPFVAKAGAALLTATLGGVPVGNLVVGGNGLSLTFIVPQVLFSGDQTLLITNPGGQAGTLTLLLVGATDNGCFVATAAWGDPEAAEVRLLRRWRDECLAGNPLGRQFVQSYYALSPGLAESIARHPWARGLSRAALTPLAGAVRLWIEAPWAFWGLLGALLLLGRRRRS